MEKQNPRHTVPLLMWALVILLTLLAAGCGRGMRPAVGDRSLVVVFADEESWTTYGEALDSVWRRRVDTPRREYVFEVRRISPDSWDYFQRFRNIVICAAIGDATRAGERIRGMLSPEARQRILDEQRAVHIVREDVWRRGQTVVILTADNSQRLLDYLERNRETLFDALRQRLYESVRRLLYARGERFEVEARMVEEWDFLVRVPEGWRLDDEEAENRFLRMIKYLPERWFFAYWVPEESMEEEGVVWIRQLEEVGRAMQEGADPDPALVTSLGREAMDFRDRITRRYYDGDDINREETTATLVTFNGRPAVRLQGLWENDEEFVGGPMVTYCFWDEPTRRVWWLDGAVFHPNEPKLSHLRQVDVMLQTFRAGPEAREYLTSIEEFLSEER
ncbi:MAG: DUF4837 family protein [bacterium]